MRIITSRVNGGQIIFMHNIETIPGVADCASVEEQCTPDAIAAALTHLQKDLNVQDDSWDAPQMDVDAVANSLYTGDDCIYGDYRLTLWF